MSTGVRGETFTAAGKPAPPSPTMPQSLMRSFISSASGLLKGGRVTFSPLPLPLKFDDIQPVILKKQYPMGSEKHLIYVTTGRKVGLGKLPADHGVVVQNVAT